MSPEIRAAALARETEQRAGIHICRLAREVRYVTDAIAKHGFCEGGNCGWRRNACDCGLLMACKSRVTKAWLFTVTAKGAEFLRDFDEKNKPS